MSTPEGSSNESLVSAARDGQLTAENLSNALRDTHATRAAIAQAIAILRNALNIT